MTGIDPADIAAMREQGDLAEFLRSLTGRPPKKPAAPAEPERPGYHIPRKGAWPCGTAATGPTPAPCTDCTPERGTTAA